MLAESSKNTLPFIADMTLRAGFTDFDQYTLAEFNKLSDEEKESFMEDIWDLANSYRRAF